MLGGGSFVTQNKILNGTYINFASASAASTAVSERGAVTMPLALDWGKEAAIFEVTAEDFKRNSVSIFGFGYSDAKAKGLRDLFATGINRLYAYRINSGGAKASCTFGTAKYGGTAGNDLKVVIAANADDDEKYDVTTYYGTVPVDVQKAVASAADLANTNDWITYDTTATLTGTAGTPLTGGTNGTVNGTSYQNYLNAAEEYSFNVMGVPTSDNEVKATVKAYTERMRDSIGKKFQTVLYDYATADYEGVISVMNSPTDTGAAAYDLVYWVTGAQAACPINESLMNRQYNGEYVIGTGYTQTQLEEAMTGGKFAFHSVNGVVRVLADINTYTDKNVPSKSFEIFSENASIRVIDQIANDIAAMFNERYLGSVVNNEDGRAALWNDIVEYHKRLENLDAITEFDNTLLTVEAGESRNSVVITDVITLTGIMAKLYMTVTVQ